MQDHYPHVFSPLRLGPFEVPNRFYFAPHSVALAAGPRPSTDYIRYYLERIEGGGVGLVIPSLTMHERGTAFQATPYRPATVASFAAFADGVHDAGAKVIGQIWYWWGLSGKWQPLGPGAPALAPSVSQYVHRGATRSTHAMGRDEIAGLAAVYSQSARHLREAGFDGVMLHAAHGGILEQFNSPYFNRRTDEYGGSLENRTRFMLECLEAVRESTRGELAVGVRFNCDEMLQGGYGSDEAGEILATICTSGLVDYVDLDVGIEPLQLEFGMPSVFADEQVYRPYIARVRHAAGGLPVLSVLGRITSVADGEAALAAGACDMVGTARALIAEPQLVQHARHGREDRSRTCIACNWCLEAMSTEGAQGCTINPASFRERTWGAGTFTPAPRRCRVIVVGGGPAGLEAARVAALRGHDVVLFEARPRLGGGVALWADLPGREWFGKSIEWWQREVIRLGVDVRLGAVASAPEVLAERPDAVIVATGSAYSPGGRSGHRDADIPGSDRPNVYRPEDILVAGRWPSGNVVLLDAEGLDASTGLAEAIARRGANVQYLTPGFSVGSPRLEAAVLLGPIVRRLKQAGVQFVPTTYISEIGGTWVRAYDTDTGEPRTIDGVDAVVLCTGRVPISVLGEALDGQVAQLFTIGDALAARPFAAASYEGQRFARMIGEPGAARTMAEAYFAAPDPAHAVVAAGE